MWGHMVVLGPQEYDVLSRATGVHRINNHVVLDKCYRGSIEAAKAVGILSGTSRCRN